MKDTLSRAASEIWRLANDHAEAAYYDAGFDAGEWSAAAHDDMERDEQYEIAKRYGFVSAKQLFIAIRERTSERWMHFCFPPLMSYRGASLDQDEYEHDSIHGRNANR
jgi:hypothetical protein